MAKAYGIHPNSRCAWKHTFSEKGAELFAQDGMVAEYERGNAELEQLLGKKEVEIGPLRNFLGRTR